MLHLPREISGTGLYCLKTGKQSKQKTNTAQQASIEEDDGHQKREFLRCVECSYPITRKSDRIVVSEKHLHVFANPHGFIYQIGCFGQAPGCITIGEESDQFPWFAGYTWQVSVCGQCLTVLGWSFRSGESRFYGLIVEKLTEDAMH